MNTGIIAFIKRVIAWLLRGMKPPDPKPDPKPDPIPEPPQPPAPPEPPAPPVPPEPPVEPDKPIDWNLLVGFLDSTLWLGDYEATIKKWSESGVNLIRLFLFDPWNCSFPYVKVNGKYDLTKFSDTYWNSLFTFIGRCKHYGIVCIVTLFDRCGLGAKYNRWPRHAWNFYGGNNTNGFINKSTGEYFYEMAYNWPTQKLYIDEVVRRLDQFENIIYEIDNESGSAPFEKAVYEYLRPKTSHKILNSGTAHIPTDFWSPHNTKGVPNTPVEAKHIGKLIFSTDGSAFPVTQVGTMIRYCKKYKCHFEIMESSISGATDEALRQIKENR